MNKEQFENLNDQDKALVKEAYFDAWQTATEVVKSYEVRTGVADHDSIIRSTTKSIADILEYSLDQMMKN